MSKLKKKAKEEQLKQFEESKKIVLELDTSLPEAKYVSFFFFFLKKKKKKNFVLVFFFLKKKKNIKKKKKKKK